MSCELSGQSYTIFDSPPDALNHVGSELHSQHMLLVQVYLLADSTFNSLAVDEVAAEHAACDCLIHFGHATLDQVHKIPTYFVLPWLTASAAAICDAIKTFRGSKECQGKHVVVLLDLALMHLRQEVAARMEVWIILLFRSSSMEVVISVAFRCKIRKRSFLPDFSVSQHRTLTQCVHFLETCTLSVLHIYVSYFC
jgi:diphthamide biosynthesis enzyme Dph1/Dph2-like protein